LEGIVKAFGSNPGVAPYPHPSFKQLPERPLKAERIESRFKAGARSARPGLWHPKLMAEGAGS